MLKFTSIALNRNDHWSLPISSGHIKENQFWWIKGSNGSGKTTLLKLLYGAITPDSGAIEKDNDLLIHFCGHNPLFDFHRCAHSQALDWVNLFWPFGVDFATLNTIVTDNFHMWRCPQFAFEKYGTLSAGQKKRIDLSTLTLSRKILNSLKGVQKKILWIVDEPLNCMDQTAQDLFWIQVNEHLNNCGSVIFTSHQSEPPPISSILEFNLNA